MGEILMSPEERQLITGLFDRINQAASAPREPEAEALIAEGVKRAPHAPYVMAQAVIVQEEGLKAASKRIEELEAKLRELESKSQPAQSTSFLGGVASNLFGGGRSPSGIPSVSPQAQTPPQPTSVWNRAAPSAPPQPYQQAAPQAGFGGQPMAAPPSAFGGGGSSFLGSALATAAGVAGGALLYDGLKSAFGGHGSSMLGSASTTSNPIAPASASPAAEAFPASAPLPPERPAFDNANIQPASYDSGDQGGFFGGSDDFSGSGDDSDWA
jgi:hypothetical protein